MSDEGALTDEALSTALKSILFRLESGECTIEEKWVLWGMVAKHRLLTTAERVEDDAWDWIALGVMLKNLAKQHDNVEVFEG